MPFQRSSSFRDNTLEDYQEDQEDTGVTGFLAIPVDLKKMGAKPESESELKKSLELLPSSKDSKKVRSFVLRIQVYVQLYKIYPLGCTCTLLTVP